MTVGELIDKLQTFDPFADVVVRQDGDDESFDEVDVVRYDDESEACVAIVIGSPDTPWPGFKKTFRKP